ncbi:MAG: hypothetical protein WD894_07510 [Pirellulales bacterium]
MSLRETIAAIVVAAGLFATGCGTSSTDAAASSESGANIDGRKYLLSHEPEGAVGVIRARQMAGDDDELVVVGRIGGGVAPWIEGRAAFVLVDPSSGITADEACDEECNCHSDELADATAVIKFVDAQGKVLAVDARRLLGVKELEMIVVKGRAKRDESGNLSVLASGIYVRR